MFVLSKSPKRKYLDLLGYLQLDSVSKVLIDFFHIYNSFPGYNGCIFAYGQTGAGKTYTIQGSGLESSGSQSPVSRGKEKTGLLPRVVEYMFSDIESAHDTSSSVVYTVKCSYLEIYNEQIVDLVEFFPYDLF